jgi:hypothetical protein
MTDPKKPTDAEVAAQKKLDDAKKNDDKPKKAKGTRLIAKIALKGDFELDDGLGVNQIEVAAGDVFTTHDAELAKKLVERNYAKKPGTKAGDDEQPDA